MLIVNNKQLALMFIWLTFCGLERRAVSHGGCYNRHAHWSVR